MATLKEKLIAKKTQGNSKDKKKSTKEQEATEVAEISVDDILSDDVQQQADDIFADINKSDKKDEVDNSDLEDLFKKEEQHIEEPVITEIKEEVVEEQPKTIKEDYTVTEEVTNYAFPNDVNSTVGQAENISHSELKDKLLKFAQDMVLTDVKDNVESELITQQAKINLITSYLNNKKPEIANYNRVLNSLVDEVLNTDYKNTVFDVLTPVILQSVKDDLDTGSW